MPAPAPDARRSRRSSPLRALLAALGGVALLLTAGCPREAPKPDEPQIRTDASPRDARSSPPRDAQALPPERPAEVSIATYNLYNLYDLVHDPEIDEGQFVPSPNGWNAAALGERLANFARVFDAIDADIVVVTEIENLAVLQSLRDVIADATGRRYPHIDTAPSWDTRGIQTGVLSRYPLVRVLGRPINNRYECTGSEPTRTLDGGRPEPRPVLQVEVDLDGDATADLVLLGNHWRSRVGEGGGECTPEDHRRRSARFLRGVISELVTAAPDRPVIALGDFNAYEFEPPFREELRAGMEPTSVSPPAGLYNTWGEIETLRGRVSHSNAWNTAQNSTYAFRGEWSRLDHILITGNALADGGAIYRLLPGSVGSVAPGFLLDGDGNPWAWRFGRGGYSDHLAVRMVLRLRD